MRRTLILLLALLFHSAIMAQSTKLSGTVLDGVTGETLPGAQIIIVGTTLTTLTNFDGQYSINLAPGTYTVLVKSFGFANK